jgi:HK97 gp10 family phage protein
MKVSIKLKGIDDLLKEIERQKSKTGLVKQEVLSSALQIKTQAQDNARALKAIDTGNLRNSIIAETTPNGLSAEIGPQAPYGPYVEFGTRHTTKMPPMEALEDWARKHGFKSAWPICQAILKRGGLTARPYLNPAFFSIEGEFFDRLKKIMEK